MNKDDVGLSYKNRLGVKSATLSQRITVNVGGKINDKWKRDTTKLLAARQRQMLMNSRPMVHISDPDIQADKRIVSFTIRNIPVFVNMLANYILRERRADRDRIGKITKAGVLKVMTSLK